MPSKVITSGFLLVMMAAVLVFVVEFFLPLSAKSDMNVACRSILLQMESSGGLTEVLREALRSELEEKGFRNVTVAGTASARQGAELSLQVEADYGYSRLTSLLTRDIFVQHMAYSKTAVSRRVIN